MARKTSQLNAIDKFIGQKIYSLRLAKRLSRQQLSKVIGVTHQQLQKYATGAHRVTASRLLLIAKVLDRQIPYIDEAREERGILQVILCRVLKIYGNLKRLV